MRREPSILAALALATLFAACADEGATTSPPVGAGDAQAQDTGGMGGDALAPDALDGGASDGAAGDAASVDDVAVDVSEDVATPADANDAGAEDAAGPPEPTPVCVAIRGNGELITAHFAALARIAELFGPFDGVAGGSSASITSFLTESMHMHPLLWTCGAATCTRAEAGARLGLLYKSLFGYLAAMGERDEAVAVGRILEVIQLAQEQGIEELIAQDKIGEAWQALLTLLSSDDVVGLVNPELLTLLQDSPDISAHVQDIWSMLSGFGSFAADDPIIFVRPGIVNFPGLAAEVGRIGSFYAGYGAFDEAGWAAFLDGCAAPGVGHPWAVVAAMDAGGQTCGERFLGLLTPWRDAFIPTEETAPNRIDDPVGGSMRVLAITSVLTGPAAATFDAAWASYQQAQPWTLPVQFSDVRAGYWGAEGDTTNVAANPRGFGDLKSAMAMSLGSVPWRLALSLSPAEPGLARGQTLDDSQVSVGGWPDLEPVLALENAGCERVVYLTRRGEASSFGRGVAKLLGATDADLGALHDLGSPASSFSLSLSEAAGVWCTDWNAHGATDLAAITEDAYNAPFEVHDPTLVPGGPAYEGATPSANLVGCTPGVTQ